MSCGVGKYIEMNRVSGVVFVYTFSTLNFSIASWAGMVISVCVHMSGTPRVPYQLRSLPVAYPRSFGYISDKLEIPVAATYHINRLDLSYSDVSRYKVIWIRETHVLT